MCQLLYVNMCRGVCVSILSFFSLGKILALVLCGYSNQQLHFNIPVFKTKDACTSVFKIVQQIQEVGSILYTAQDSALSLIENALKTQGMGNVFIYRRIFQGFIIFYSFLKFFSFFFLSFMKGIHSSSFLLQIQFKAIW